MPPIYINIQSSDEDDDNDTHVSNSMEHLSKHLYVAHDGTQNFYERLHTQYIMPYGFPLFQKSLDKERLNDYCLTDSPKTRLHLRAHIVDYLGTSSASEYLCTYLRAIGFAVNFDTSKKQIGLSCGVVAAKVAHHLKASKRQWFKSTDHRRATQDYVLHYSNNILQKYWLQKNGEHRKDVIAHMVNAELCRKEGRLCLNTLYLNESEIMHLCQTWSANTMDDPEVVCCALDIAVYHVITDILKTRGYLRRRNSDEKQSYPKIFIVNTGFSGTEGDHWFVLAFSVHMRRRSH